MPGLIELVIKSVFAKLHKKFPYKISAQLVDIELNYLLNLTVDHAYFTRDINATEQPSQLASLI